MTTYLLECLRLTIVLAPYVALSLIPVLRFSQQSPRYAQMQRHTRHAPPIPKQIILGALMSIYFLAFGLLIARLNLTLLYDLHAAIILPVPAPSFTLIDHVDFLVLAAYLFTGSLLLSKLSGVEYTAHRAFLGANCSLFLSSLKSPLISVADAVFLIPLAVLSAAAAVILSLGVAVKDDFSIIAGEASRDSPHNLLVCLTYASFTLLLALLSPRPDVEPVATLLAGVTCLAGTSLTYRTFLRLIAKVQEDPGDLREKQKLEQSLQFLVHHYGAISDYMREIRTARHDLRHHLSVLEQYASNGDIQRLAEYLVSIRGSDYLETSLSICGNPAVDAVARHYLGLAMDAGVEMDVVLDIPEDVGIPASDLCIIMGNCLENASDAAMKSSNGIIRIRSENTDSRLTVVIGNSYSGELRVKDGFFLSTKTPTREGIGLSSIRAIAEKYDGYAKFEASDGIFTTSFILFKPHEPSPPHILPNEIPSVSDP